MHFIRAIAKTVLHISAGQLTPYAGDYDYYLDKSRATSARAALTAGNALQNAQPISETVAAPRTTPGLREMKEQKRAEAEQRKAAAKVRREHEKRVADLEMHIATLEGRQKELAALSKTLLHTSVAARQSPTIANSRPSSKNSRD